jgi:hypothetical protein
MRVLALAAALVVAAMSGAATQVSADPWKDGSGHGRWRYERSDSFRGRDEWRERRASRYYGERPHRQEYHSRRVYREDYGYRPRRAYRDPYAGLPRPVYRRFPGDVPRSTPYGYTERGARYSNRAYGFDEREYLRCNRDVLRAVRRGQMQSGTAHYQIYGLREGRPLSC